MEQQLEDKLYDLAYSRTDNFCYQCYKIVEESSCPTCHCDDFMRHMEGVGVEYGVDWVIDSLIKENCTPIDQNEYYDEFLDDCYDEIKIGYSTWTASEVLKELDPVSYLVGKGEYFDDEEVFHELDCEYYLITDIENMADYLL